MDTPISTASSTLEASYCIDHTDHITSVDDNWVRCALANGATELTRDAVCGTDIWRYIGDADTRLLYRMVFDSVRRNMKPLSVSYRCDSPTRRRLMQLTCMPRPKLAIELQNHLIREEQRPYVRMLDPDAPHSENVVKICAWCSRCRIDQLDWREIEDAIGQLRMFEFDNPAVTHGMCPDCHVEKLKEIRRGGHNEPRQ